MIICTLLYLLIFTMPNYATANNVADCFEGNKDCEEIKEINVHNFETKERPNVDKNEQDSVIADNSQQATPSLFRNFVQMIFALLLVLGLIYIMLKLVNRRQQLFSQTQTLENLGGISVGQNKSIQVIRVGSKMYLVGVGENVQLLREIDDETIKADLSHKQVKDSMTFKEWMKSFLPTNAQKKEKDQSNTFRHLLTNELDEMKDNRQQMIKQFAKKDDTHE